MRSRSTKPLEVFLTTKWGRSVWIALGVLILAIIGAIILAVLLLGSTPSGPQGTVNSVAFSPDGKNVVTGGEDGIVRLWDIETAKTIQTFKGHTDSVTDVAFSPDGGYVVSASNDQTVRLWNTTTGQPVRVFSIPSASPHRNFTNCVAFSPDSKDIVTGDGNDAALLLDITTGHVIRTFVGHIADVSSVAFSADGQTVLAGSMIDNTAQMWNVATGQLIHAYASLSIVDDKEYADPVNSVAVSPDSKYVLTAGNHSTVQLYDLASGQLIRKINVPTSSLGWVPSATFSPDGKFIAAGSDDTNVRLWDAASGQLIRTFAGHRDVVTSVAFSPDGKYILSGSEDGQARLWNVATGQSISTFGVNYLF